MKKFNKKILLSVAILFTFGLVGSIIVFAFASPAIVDLGTAGNFTILSKTAVSTTGATSITGDVGISPAAATALTGFSQTMDSSNKFSTSTYVIGKLYAANYTAPTPSYTGTAVSDMEAAYTDAMGRAIDETDRLGGTLPLGNTFTTGVYNWGSNVNITGNITLTGSATDIFIFQITGNLDIASSTSVLLAGGALSSNIFWAVAGTTTLNTASVFEGNILAGPATSTIAMLDGARLNGKALGQKDITLINNTVSSTGGTSPQLTVTKVVINDDGKNSVIADFPLFVGATSVVSGVSNTFTTGTYVITETTNSNYTQTFSGDCDSNGNITLFSGDNLTCIITNNDIATPSSGGSSIVYGCNDPSALNYDYFSSSDPSLCQYRDSVSPVVYAPTINTPIVITLNTPKFPKTGFRSEQTNSWYMNIIFDVLSIFKLNIK